MSEKLIKEKINWYKLLFTVSITTLAACVSWFVANIGFKVRWIFVFDECLIAFLLIGIGVFVCKIRYYFKRLEEIDDD